MDALPYNTSETGTAPPSWAAWATLSCTKVWNLSSGANTQNTGKVTMFLKAIPWFVMGQTEKLSCMA